MKNVAPSWPVVGKPILFVFFALLYALFVARTTFHHDGRLVGTLFDDALISMRYAFNLYSGAGPVWNPGEVPPVEGYTDPLWMLVMSATFFFGSWLIAPILVSAIGAVILLLCGALAWRIAQAASDDKAIAILAAFLTLSSLPTVFWTLRGMEVGLVTLLVMLGLQIVVGRAANRSRDGALALTSLLAGLAYLTRPDAILLFAPMLLLQILPVRLAWPFLSPRGLISLAPAPICVAGQLAFRWSYYGDLNPNTYYLKMTGGALGERLAAGVTALLAAAPTIVLVLVPIVWLLSRRPTAGTAKARLAWIVVGLTMIQSVYLVAIGGDAWGPDNSNRFVATITPPLLIGCLLCLPDIWEWLGQRRIAFVLFGLIIFGGGLALQLLGFPALGPRSNLPVVLGAAMLCGWPLFMRQTLVAAALSLFLISAAPGWIRWVHLNAHGAVDDIAFAQQGLFLRERLPPGTTFAAFWLGAPAYYSGLKAIDLLGKTDKHVAHMKATEAFRSGHNKMDLDYSIGRLQPDVVIGNDRRLGRFGYVDLGNFLWLRPAFADTLPDKTALEGNWCQTSTSIYCPR